MGEKEWQGEVVLAKGFSGDTPARKGARVTKTKGTHGSEAFGVKI